MLKTLLLTTIMLSMGLVSCVKPGTPTTPTYPNQLNSFDGTAYSTLTIAQAALTKAKELAPQFPQYKTQLNDAILTYNTALAAYKTWHAITPTPDPTELDKQLNLLVSQVGTVLSAFGVKL